MPIAKDSGGNFTPAPTGTHIARCISVIALGTQNSPNFPASFKVMLVWELPSEPLVNTATGERKPMIANKEYTLSLSEKSKLRADLVSWRGRIFTPEELKQFDVAKVLGFPCMLTIVHKTSSQGKVYAVVSGVTGLPKGTVCPERVHPLALYEIEHGKNEVFAKLPAWIQKKIENCEEWLHPAAMEAPEPEPEPEAPEESAEVPF